MCVLLQEAYFHLSYPLPRQKKTQFAFILENDLGPNWGHLMQTEIIPQCVSSMIQAHGTMCN